MIIAFSSDNSFETLIKSLKENGLNIDFLITEKPKKSGRGQTLKPNQAHSYALKLGIGVAAISSNDEIEEVVKNIGTQNIQVGLVFSFGRIITEQVIKLFGNKIINLHPSLLPKYRGATPIQSAILNGENEFGFSVIQIDKTCDGGPILYQEKINLAEESDYCTIKEKIIKHAGTVIPNLINEFLSNKLESIKQNRDEASYTKKFQKSDGLLNNDDAITAYRKVRAFCEWPKAYFEIESQRLIVLKAKLSEKKLEVIEVQMEGKKRMDFKSFKNGHSLLLTKLPSFVKI